MGIGTKISCLARIRGYSQGDLEKKCGISRISVNRFFKDRSELKTQDLVNVLKAMGIDIEAQIDRQLGSSSLQMEQPETGDSGAQEMLQLVQGLNDRVRRTLIQQIRWWRDLENQKRVMNFQRSG